MRKSLTKKQQAWIDHYVICLNATEAARRAGYKWPNKVGPYNIGALRDEIDHRMKELVISADETLARVSAHATGSMADFIVDDPIYGYRIDLNKADELGRLGLIKKYKETQNTTINNKTGDEYTTIRREVELYPSDTALDKLMRYYSLYSDKVKIEDWQSDIVRMLRDGELTPEDVKAAYPDLASQFFAKAGIDASNDS